MAAALLTKASTFLQSMTETDLVSYSSWIMIASGICTLLALFVTTAPYGRYNNDMKISWLPMMRPRVAWVLMETPNLWVYVFLSFSGSIKCKGAPNIILILMFLCHYVHRSLIFPFQMRAGADMPVHVMLLAMLYCTWNALTQTVYLTRSFCYRCVHAPKDCIFDSCFISLMQSAMAGYLTRDFLSASLFLGLGWL